MDAVSEAVRLAHRLGLQVDEPVALRSTNNIVVWLRPSPVVAKISIHQTESTDELAIAQRLDLAGAPVVAPTDLVDPGVHQAGEWYVTFWRHVVPDDAPATSAAVARALRDLHESLALPDVSRSRPSCAVKLSDALHALSDPDFAPGLDDGDRAALGGTLSQAMSVLEPRVASTVIHGSPHRFNILAVNEQPYFIDFETVARGPVEWDLAHLEPEVALHYGGSLDGDLLARCRLAISATTATWCWGALDRGPDMRTHAEHHLALVKADRPAV